MATLSLSAVALRRLIHGARPRTAACGRWHPPAHAIQKSTESLRTGSSSRNMPAQAHPSKHLLKDQVWMAVQQRMAHLQPCTAVLSHACTGTPHAAGSGPQGCHSQQQSVGHFRPGSSRAPHVSAGNLGFQHGLIFAIPHSAHLLHSSKLTFHMSACMVQASCLRASFSLLSRTAGSRRKQPGLPHWTCFATVLLLPWYWPGNNHQQRLAWSCLVPSLPSCCLSARTAGRYTTVKTAEDNQACFHVGKPFRWASGLVI